MTAIVRCTILACLCALLPAGCASDGRGFTQESPYSTQLRSIAVPAFANATKDRKVSQNLTEAVVKEIQTATPWKVTGQGRADTILRGTLTDYRLVLLSKDPTTGLANEMLVQATVSFEFL